MGHSKGRSKTIQINLGCRLEFVNDKPAIIHRLDSNKHIHTSCIVKKLQIKTYINNTFSFCTKPDKLNIVEWYNFDMQAATLRIAE